MNASDRDTILAAWLDEGPADLPDATRRAILAALPTTPQARRGLLAPRRVFPMLTPTRALIAIAVAAIAIGGTISLLRSPGSAGVGGQTPASTPSLAPSATPSSPPQASPTPDLGTPSPLQGRASSFPVPFSYTLPAGAGLVVSDDTDWWQFRHPAPDGLGYDTTTAVRAVTGGRVDPCQETSPARPLEGPQAFIDYFRTIPTVNVSDVHPKSIDGRPALEVTLSFSAPTAACADVWLWTEEGSITQNNGRQPARVLALEVDGKNVVIVSQAKAEFVPTEDAFISSIRFDAPKPSSSTH